MIFKRRDKRSWHRVLADSVWPRRGWGRALNYMSHRLRRLPDTPHRIARGVFAGIFVSFTPFYGFHFITAFIVSRIIGGNVLAAVIATFVGNPVTFPFIAAISLTIGHWMLGTRHIDGVEHNLVSVFSGAFADLVQNTEALFDDRVANWHRLSLFYDDIFLPFLVGGIVPGIIAGLIGYYLTLPLIIAYQNRRQMRLRKKFDEIRANAIAATKTGGTGQ